MKTPGYWVDWKRQGQLVKGYMTGKLKEKDLIQSLGIATPLRTKWASEGTNVYMCVCAENVGKFNP